MQGEAEATKTNFPATSATVTVLESGPLRAKVRVHYIGMNMRNFGPTPFWPSQTNAYYICDITLEAGQPVIHFEQETDHRPEWHVNMNTGVNADRARWRGHSSNSIAQGHNYDGTIASGVDSTDTDAEINLSEGGQRGYLDKYGIPYSGFDGVHYQNITVCSGVVYDRLAVIGTPIIRLAAAIVTFGD